MNNVIEYYIKEIIEGKNHNNQNSSDRSKDKELLYNILDSFLNKLFYFKIRCKISL